MKRFSLRIPDELHTVLVEEANAHGLSLHQLLLLKMTIPWKKGLESWYKKTSRKKGGSR
ncbi:MAG: toxin-antitoxin system HicB family antitoxin [Deltaproteobacteria bacterium]|nr:toxin-antitoxin system HicB family antitoxin [Deltaproteobacteria bacterium]